MVSKHIVIPHKPWVMAHGEEYGVHCTCGWKQHAFNRQFALMGAIYHLRSLMAAAA